MRTISRLAIGAGVCAVLVGARSAIAQKGGPCGPDIRVFCTALEAGHGAMQRCLQEHLGDLSSACRAHLQRGIERARTPKSRNRPAAGRAKQANE